MSTTKLGTVEPKTPSVAVAMAISPSTYSHADGEDAVPNLSISATLDSAAAGSVTLQTWPTIFNPSLALKRRNFTARDISQEPPKSINLEITKGPKRPGFQRRKGSDDEKFYLTLHPGQEIRIADQPLNIVKRVKDDAPIFQASHTYSLELSDEGKEVRTWWWGTADDVLDEVDGPPKDVSSIEGKGAIILSTDPVQFDIVG